MALLYEANTLKRICEEEIGIKAKQVLKSSSFLNVSFEFLENIIRCDTLICEENDILKACIAWAKAACERNNQDSSDGRLLRSQLKDIIREIRFISMTKEEIGQCVRSCRGLFTAKELEELICIISQTKFEATEFNMTHRNRNIPLNKFPEFKCSRNNSLWNYVIPYGARAFVEELSYPVFTTTFTCNRPVLLKRFYCECSSIFKNEYERIFLEIFEINSNGDRNKICKEIKRLHFSYEVHERKYMLLPIFEAIVELDNFILIRPNYTYKIVIFIEIMHFSPTCKWIKPVSSVQVDSDITIKFSDTKGIVSTLILSRIDDSPSMLSRFQQIFFTFFKFISITIFIFAIILCALAYQQECFPNFQHDVLEFFDIVNSTHYRPERYEYIFNFIGQIWQNFQSIQTNDEKMDQKSEQFFIIFSNKFLFEWIILIFKLFHIIVFGIYYYFLTFWIINSIKFYEKLTAFQIIKTSVYYCAIIFMLIRVTGIISNILIFYYTKIFN